jgi:hypothetical protein
MLKNELSKLHIATWLLKDVFWCFKLTSLAVFMIIPTSIIALYMLIDDKDNRLENGVLMSWLTLNIFWMLHELVGLSLFFIYPPIIIGLIMTGYLLKAVVIKLINK